MGSMALENVLFFYSILAGTRSKEEQEQFSSYPMWIFGSISGNSKWKVRICLVFIIRVSINKINGIK